MAFSPKEVISFDIEANPKKAIVEVTKFQQSLSTHMKKAQDSTGKLDKGFERLWRNISQSRDRTAGLKALNAQLKTTDEALKKRAPYLEQLLKIAKGTKRGSDARKHAMSQVAAYKKAESVDSLRSTRRDTQQGTKELQELPKIDWEEAGEILSEPLHDLLSKDAPTLIKRLAKIAMGAHNLAKGTRDAGQKLSDRGSSMMKKGGFVGKAVGGAAKAGGEITKMFGSLASVITSIGPILSAVSGFMMSFIKVMIDAEGAAKDFNKQLLASTSTASFLSRNFGDVQAAAKDMGNSLDMARNAAKNEANIGFFTAEAAASFQSAITAEGVALDSLGKANEGATVSVERHIKTLQQGVAFARTFGVSISEIATMQGQMMSDIGLSADGVTAGFQSVLEGAKNAGMEAGKFFGIVRGFSSDLSLFSLRIEDVSQILGVMNKNMDPRKTGQYLQQLNQKYSGGVVENMKNSALAGPEGRRILEADVGRKSTKLEGDIRGNLGKNVSEQQIGELLKLMKAGDALGIGDWEVQFGQLNASIKEEITELANYSTLVSSGSDVDLSEAMRYASAMAKLDLADAVNVGAVGTRLKDTKGDATAASEAAGAGSAEDRLNAKKRYAAIVGGQAELIKQIKEGASSPEAKARVSDQAKRLMKANNLELGDKGAAEMRKIFTGKKGEDAYTDSLSATDADLLAGAEKVVDFQKEAASLQVSMLDRIGMIYDVLLNKIYNVMQWIWNAVTDILSVLRIGRDKRAEFSRASDAAKQSGDAGLQKAFSGDPNDLTGAKNKAITENTRRAVEGLTNAAKEAGNISNQLATEKDSGKKAKLENRMTELKPALDMYNKYVQGKDLQQVKDSLGETGKNEAAGGVPEVVRLLSEWLKAGKDVPVAAAGTPEKDKYAEADKLPTADGLPTAPPEGFVASIPMAPAPSAMIGGNMMDEGLPKPSALMAGAGNNMPDSGLIGGSGFASAPTTTNVKVEVAFTGDLKRVVRVQAIEASAAHDRNRKKA